MCSSTGLLKGLGPMFCKSVWPISCPRGDPRLAVACQGGAAVVCSEEISQKTYITLRQLTCIISLPHPFWAEALARSDSRQQIDKPESK